MTRRVHGPPLGTCTATERKCKITWRRTQQSRPRPRAFSVKFRRSEWRFFSFFNYTIKLRWFKDRKSLSWTPVDSVAHVRNMLVKMGGKKLIPDLQTYVPWGTTRLRRSYTVAATLWFSAETLKRLLITPAALQVISQLLSAASLIS